MTDTPPASAGPPDLRLVEDLVAANRILVDPGMVDGDGHVSVSHDGDPNRDLMSRSRAPELVTAATSWRTTSTASRWMLATAEQARQVMEVTHAADLAAERHAPVTLPLDRYAP